ncbi:MAG: hypothetical protein IPI51_07300 [Betaproteobacteria bacterium]|nr:hypothetical protein [Betaproteobacteria bacterium]
MLTTSNSSCGSDSRKFPSSSAAIIALILICSGDFTIEFWLRYSRAGAGKALTLSGKGFYNVLLLHTRRKQWANSSIGVACMNYTFWTPNDSWMVSHIRLSSGTTGYVFMMACKLNSDAVSTDVSHLPLFYLGTAHHLATAGLVGKI